MVSKLGRFVVDEAIYKLTMEGVAESQAKMDKFEKHWRKALESKGTAGIVQDVKKLDMEINKLSSHSKAVTDVSKNMATGVEKTGNEAKKAGDKFGYLNAKIDNLSKLYDIQWAIKGMFMGVGWQMITTMIEGLKTVVNDLFMANVELESSMIAIETVAQRTGRSFGEVRGIISSSFDVFTDKAKLTSGTMKLLSTSLSTSEIKEFINAVKQGSAAMGMDFNEQLELMARGFKQLTPNLLDNIGVTVYLDDVRRKASQSLGVEVTALTEAQIHHQLLQEILLQTTKYEGLWEAQMDTTKGTLMALNTQYKLFMQSIASSEPIKIAADTTTRLLENLRLTGSILSDLNKYGIKDYKEFIETVYGEDYAKKYRHGLGDVPIVDKRMISDQISAVDMVVERLAEMQKVYGPTIQLTDMYQGILGSAADVMTVTKDKLTELIEEELKVNDVREKTIMLLDSMGTQMDNYSEYLEDGNRAVYNLTEEGKKYSSMLKELNNQHTTGIKMMSDWEKSIKKNNTTLYWMGKTLGDYNLELTESKNKLSELTAQEKNANSVYKETEDRLKDINKQLEEKLKVLYPEQLATEKKLLQIQKDLESARKSESSAEDDLYKRVEPTLFRKHQKDYAEAQEEVMRYTEGEKKLKATLMAEIAALSRERDAYNSKLDRELGSIRDIVILIEQETRTRDALQKKVNDLKLSMSELNEENKHTKHLMEGMTNEGGTLPTLESKIEDVTTAINKMYTSWNEGKFDLKTIEFNQKFNIGQPSIYGTPPGGEQGTAETSIFDNYGAVNLPTSQANNNRTSNTSNTFQPGSIVLNTKGMSAAGLFESINRESKFKMAQSVNE